ncbi:MAG: carotenoid biosynthesis protein [Spirochaetota bacterium]
MSQNRGSFPSQGYYTWVPRLLALFYAVGLLGHTWDRTRELMITLTPYMILATIVLAVIPYVVLRDKGVLLWAAITGFITLVLEIIGVKTGMIFGSYEYGQTLGLQLLEVPLLIGMNWIIVVLGALAVLERLTNRIWLRIAGTAVFTVLFDIVLEPVAIELDYWSWSGGAIPLQNYIAWGIISACCAGLFQGMKLSYRRNTVVLSILGIQLLFFLGLNLFVVS